MEGSIRRVIASAVDSLALLLMLIYSLCVNRRRESSLSIIITRDLSRSSARYGFLCGSHGESGIFQVKRTERSGM